jgi:formylglycine-generating enzyme
MAGRRRRLLGVLCLALVPASCANLLGLEPGILDAGGSQAAGGEDNQGGSSTAGSAGHGNGIAGTVVTAGASGLGGNATANVGGSSTDGGAAGDAGAPALPDGGEPSTGPCKNGTCIECPVGMQQSRSSEAYYYCIDAAEVTNEEYLAFTERYTTASVVASTACANNKTLVPDTDCSTALTDVPSRKLPVVCVDYCDAEAYCAMQGKRLCGRMGGTMNDPSDNANAAASEWYAACSGPGETNYPYGDAASASKCNASGYAPSDMGPRDLATMSECEGGYAGIFNLSGNVAEWEWSCSSSAANATCSTRGGSFVDGPYEVRCAGTINRARQDAADDVGFRCCANLKN